VSRRSNRTRARGARKGPKNNAGRRRIEILGVRSSLGFSQEELARVTGYSVRAIAGWEAGKKLSGAARQKVVETDRLRAALAEIMPAAEVGTWMRAPNPAFEGQTPIQVIERGETDRIWLMIVQIDAGVAN
jgi:transcriptional regulator with XRE-family HTH domain